MNLLTAPRDSVRRHLPRNASQWRRLVPCLALLLMLSACQKELYGQLTERDSNEMTAALIEDGVDAQKTTPDGGKTWTVTVDEKQLVRSMEILRARGIPQKNFDNLGSLFKKDSLVSTPTEERVRFIYGMSQELDDTLSKIDGVVVARVQIVLPNNDPLAQSTKPSSASVFIKYRADADLDTLTPAIKNLVVHSIEGLTYDQVSVTSIPASPLNLPAQPAQHSGVLVIVAALLGLLLSVSAVLFVLLRGKAMALFNGSLLDLLPKRANRAAKTVS
jgi:type III secretion protein J